MFLLISYSSVAKIIGTNSVLSDIGDLPRDCRQLTCFVIVSCNSGNLLDYLLAGEGLIESA